MLQQYFKMGSMILTIVSYVLKIITLPFYIGQLVFIITSKFIVENDNQKKLYTNKIYQITKTTYIKDWVVIIKVIPYLLYLSLIFVVKQLIMNNTNFDLEDNIFQIISNMNFLFCLLIVFNILKCIFVFNNDEYIYLENGFIMPKVTLLQYIIITSIFIFYNGFIHSFLLNCYDYQFKTFNIHLIIVILMYLFFKYLITLPAAKFDENYYKSNIGKMSKISLNLYYFILSILSFFIIIFIAIACGTNIVSYNILKLDYFIMPFIGIVLLLLGGMRDEFVFTTRKFFCVNKKLYYKNIDGKSKLIGNIDDDSDNISKYASINCKNIK